MKANPQTSQHLLLESCWVFVGIRRRHKINQSTERDKLVLAMFTMLQEVGALVPIRISKETGVWRRSFPPRVGSATAKQTAAAELLNCSDTSFGNCVLLGNARRGCIQHPMHHFRSFLKLRRIVTIKVFDRTPSRTAGMPEWCLPPTLSPLGNTEFHPYRRQS